MGFVVYTKSGERREFSNITDAFAYALACKFVGDDVIIIPVGEDKRHFIWFTKEELKCLR